MTRGALLRRARYVEAVDDFGQRLLPNGQPDPAPDCYAVRRVEPGVFRVEHFADGDARVASCSFEARRIDADLEVAARDGLSVDIVTLARVRHRCHLLGGEQ